MVGVPAKAQRPAESRDDDMARTLFETARAYFERAQYAEAAEAFGKAYKLSGRPPLLINQAKALEADGQVGAAIAALEQYLEVAPEDDPLRDTVAAQLRRLRAAAARQADGSEATPADATEREAEAAPRGVMGWTGLGAAGLAGASAIIAVATGIAAHRIHGSLEDDCPGGICPPERAGDLDRGRRLSVTSTAFTFVGIGAGVAAALLLILGRDRGERPEPAVQVTGGPGMVGTGLRVRF
jgi:tetratricopeptide (TPR) repeat protein